jgi:hypothetical protein
MLGAMTPTYAADANDFLEIHGFGGWAFGDTDGYRFLVGTGDGSYDNAQMALNFNAQPADRFSVVGQVRFDATGGDDEVELDYAFAGWAFSDALELRIGRVKHPFGVYGEIFDVGVLRPFYLLPQSIYGANGFTARAYNGVGITGFRAFGGWDLQYDVYTGEIEGDFVVPGLLSTQPELLTTPEVEVGFEVDETLGFRLNLGTPIQGLSFGLSAYQGQETLGLDLVDDGDRKTVVGSVEYLGNALTVRSEYGHLEDKGAFEETGGYLEVAYRINDHWQLAARYDDFEVKFPEADLSQLPSILTDVMRHEELAVGVNYWFNASFVVRLNYHMTEGNRFAFPESGDEILTAIVTGELEASTDLLLVGAQFSF